MAVLEKLNAVSPKTKWWVKGDGTDVVKGLWQSVSGEWGGDTDLNDGKLQQTYDDLQKLLKWINSIGLNGSNVYCIKEDLQKALLFRYRLYFCW